MKWKCLSCKGRIKEVISKARGLQYHYFKCVRCGAEFMKPSFRGGY